MKAFTDYTKAHTYATELATACSRDVGIEKGEEFGRTVFRTFLLPNKENRCGHELHCEVVTPNTPV